MKPSMSGRVRNPTIDGEVELLDTVRARLVQGHDRAQLPRNLHLMFGVDEAAVHAAIAAVDAEHRAARRDMLREFAMAGALAGASGLLVALAVKAFGFRAFSTIGFGTAAAALVVVLVVARRRRG